MKFGFLSLLFFLSCSSGDRKVFVLDKATFYDGCLLFVDDVNEIPSEWKAHSLIRSWYRFGEPAPDKQYALRAKVLRNEQMIPVGGGTSLSVLNDRDLKRKDFDPKWLTVDLEGKPVKEGKKSFGSLSVPGFRRYLIERLMEQVELGVAELHLGETNGKILYEAESLKSFAQWLKEKYPKMDQAWWRKYLGELGVAIAYNRPVTRNLFQNFSAEEMKHFDREWGETDSWHGTNSEGRPAFLAYQYRKNLEAFLSELKVELDTKGHDQVAVDVWGTAEWMKGIKPSPDAVLTSPPDERWGLNWNTEADFDLEGKKEKIKRIMLKDKADSAPSKLVYIFDHPKPFLSSFVNLPDGRQAELSIFFSKLSEDIGAKFAIRSYSETNNKLGPLTKNSLRDLCHREIY